MVSLVTALPVARAVSAHAHSWPLDALSPPPTCRPFPVLPSTFRNEVLSAITFSLVLKQGVWFSCEFATLGDTVKNGYSLRTATDAQAVDWSAELRINYKAGFAVNVSHNGLSNIDGILSMYDRFLYSSLVTVILSSWSALPCIGKACIINVLNHKWWVQDTRLRWEKTGLMVGIMSQMWQLLE